MTVEPGHDSFEKGRGEKGSGARPTTQSTPIAQHATYNAARHGNHVEESPELLRWRADLLMDEMMMGGVDVSAADGNRTFSGVDAPVVQRPQTPANGSHSRTGPSNGGNGGPYPSTHSNGVPSNGINGNGTYSNSNGTHERSADGDAARKGYDEGYRHGYSAHDYADAPNPSAPTSETYSESNSALNGRGYPSPSANHQVSHDSRTFAPRQPEVDDNSNLRSGNDYRREQTREPYRDVSRDASSAQGYSSSRSQPIASTHDDFRRTDNGYVERQSPEDNARGISAPRQYPDQMGGQTPRPETRGDVESTRDLSAFRPNTDDALRDMSDMNSGVSSVANDEPPPRTDRLYAVEQQYEQFRREQSENVSPVENKSVERQRPAEPPRPAERPPLPPVEPSRPPSSPPRVTPPPVDEHTEWATGPDKWEYRDFGSDPATQANAAPANGAPAPERRVERDSAVRHDPAQFVSAMSVKGNGKKRSTLLPRSTELDVDTLHREISDLHSDIAMLLPVGNETSERARHLLDKAYSILQSDPSRSAEVEYYMQQVRSIVQRLHQSRQWSDLYRQRLHVYLLGWLGLSSMVLLARFFFQIDLEDMLMWMFGVDANSWVIAHWATFVGTAGAGAFGGALGALYTMRGHARGEHSFFDRKYGLRGLILPFMGLLVGAIGYVLFGLLFALVGINPAQSLTAAIVPTVSALAFGFSQESIYGTRG